MNARLRSSQILFVRVQPSLIGILEGSRERRHDFATVAKITSNFCPFLQLANLFESPSNFDCFLEFVEIEGSFVNAWESVEVGPKLFMELGQLVEVVEIGARP